MNHPWSYSLVRRVRVGRTCNVYRDAVSASALQHPDSVGTR